MRITVDHERCVGAGQCVLSAPEVFDQSEEDGTSVVREPHPAPEHHDAARRAADLCPGRAVRLD
ncbi:ferredoxin [Streptomyces sp. NL15-2K]|uniref:ferredoxin n=1 Tax=Streptomyces sp. NL15-2K TaxID=376149 RepID=UPI000F55C172|nr:MULTISPECIES: ferredoxin [Actinomycetes]WKX06018.1 ferredoxin [Kutzneria buriramensis]GCB53262.1 ferredoxin [Streptomyces sp. NL15-2K]